LRLVDASASSGLVFTHYAAATTRRNLAAILATRDLLDEAAEEYGAAPEVCRAQLALGHPSTRTMKENLQRLEASRQP
jgi:hypothetical protein